MGNEIDISMVIQSTRQITFPILYLIDILINDEFSSETIVFTFVINSINENKSKLILLFLLITTFAEIAMRKRSKFGEKH